MLLIASLSKILTYFVLLIPFYETINNSILRLSEEGNLKKIITSNLSESDEAFMSIEDIVVKRG